MTEQTEGWETQFKSTPASTTEKKGGELPKGSYKCVLKVAKLDEANTFKDGTAAPRVEFEWHIVEGPFERWRIWQRHNLYPARDGEFYGIANLKQDLQNMGVTVEELTSEFLPDALASCLHTTAKIGVTYKTVGDKTYQNAYLNEVIGSETNADGVPTTNSKEDIPF